MTSNADGLGSTGNISPLGGQSMATEGEKYDLEFKTHVKNSSSGERQIKECQFALQESPSDPGNFKLKIYVGEMEYTVVLKEDGKNILTGGDVAIDKLRYQAKQILKIVFSINEDENFSGKIRLVNGKVEDLSPDLKSKWETRKETEVARKKHSGTKTLEKLTTDCFGRLMKPKDEKWRKRATDNKTAAAAAGVMTKPAEKKPGKEKGKGIEGDNLGDRVSMSIDSRPAKLGEIADAVTKALDRVKTTGKLPKGEERAVLDLFNEMLSSLKDGNQWDEGAPFLKLRERLAVLDNFLGPFIEELGKSYLERERLSTAERRSFSKEENAAFEEMDTIVGPGFEKLHLYVKALQGLEVKDLNAMRRGLDTKGSQPLSLADVKGKLDTLNAFGNAIENVDVQNNKLYGLGSGVIYPQEISLSGWEELKSSDFVEEMFRKFVAGVSETLNVYQKLLEEGQEGNAADIEGLKAVINSLKKRLEGSRGVEELKGNLEQIDKELEAGLKPIGKKLARVSSNSSEGDLGETVESLKEEVARLKEMIKAQEGKKNKGDSGGKDKGPVNASEDIIKLLQGLAKRLAEAENERVDEVDDEEGNADQNADLNVTLSALAALLPSLQGAVASKSSRKKAKPKEIKVNPGIKELEKAVAAILKAHGDEEGVTDNEDDDDDDDEIAQVTQARDMLEAFAKALKPKGTSKSRKASEEERGKQELIDAIQFVQNLQAQLKAEGEPEDDGDNGDYSGALDDLEELAAQILGANKPKRKKGHVAKKRFTDRIKELMGAFSEKQKVEKTADKKVSKKKSVTERLSEIELGGEGEGEKLDNEVTMRLKEAERDLNGDNGELDLEALLELFYEMNNLEGVEEDSENNDRLENLLNEILKKLNKLGLNKKDFKSLDDVDEKGLEELRKRLQGVLDERAEVEDAKVVAKAKEDSDGLLLEESAATLEGLNGEGDLDGLLDLYAQLIALADLNRANQRSRSGLLRGISRKLKALGLTDADLKTLKELANGSEVGKSALDVIKEALRNALVKIAEAKEKEEAEGIEKEDAKAAAREVRGLVSKFRIRLGELGTGNLEGLESLYKEILGSEGLTSNAKESFLGEILRKIKKLTDLEVNKKELVNLISNLGEVDDSGNLKKALEGLLLKKIGKAKTEALEGTKDLDVLGAVVEEWGEILRKLQGKANEVLLGSIKTLVKKLESRMKVRDVQIKFAELKKADLNALVELYHEVAALDDLEEVDGESRDSLLGQILNAIEGLNLEGEEKEEDLGSIIDLIGKGGDEKLLVALKFALNRYLKAESEKNKKRTGPLTDAYRGRAARLAALLARLEGIEGLDDQALKAIGEFIEGTKAKKKEDNSNRVSSSAVGGSGGDSSPVSGARNRGAASSSELEALLKQAREFRVGAENLGDFLAMLRRLKAKGANGTQLREALAKLRAYLAEGSQDNNGLDQDGLEDLLRELATIKSGEVEFDGDVDKLLQEIEAVLNPNKGSLESLESAIIKISENFKEIDLDDPKSLFVAGWMVRQLTEFSVQLESLKFDGEETPKVEELERVCGNLSLKISEYICAKIRENFSLLDTKDKLEKFLEIHKHFANEIEKNFVNSTASEELKTKMVPFFNKIYIALKDSNVTGNALDKNDVLGFLNESYPVFVKLAELNKKNLINCNQSVTAFKNVQIGLLEILFKANELNASSTSCYGDFREKVLSKCSALPLKRLALNTFYCYEDANIGFFNSDERMKKFLYLIEHRDVFDSSLPHELLAQDLRESFPKGFVSRLEVIRVKGDFEGAEELDDIHLLVAAERILPTSTTTNTTEDANVASIIVALKAMLTGVNKKIALNNIKGILGKEVDQSSIESLLEELGNLSACVIQLKELSGLAGVDLIVEGVKERIKNVEAYLRKKYTSLPGDSSKLKMETILKCLQDVVTLQGLILPRMEGEWEGLFKSALSCIMPGALKNLDVEKFKLEASEENFLLLNGLDEFIANNKGSLEGGGLGILEHVEKLPALMREALAVDLSESHSGGVPLNKEGVATWKKEVSTWSSEFGKRLVKANNTESRSLLFNEFIARKKRALASFPEAYRLMFLSLLKECKASRVVISIEGGGLGHSEALSEEIKADLSVFLESKEDDKASKYTHLIEIINGVPYLDLVRDLIPNTSDLVGRVKKEFDLDRDKMASLALSKGNFSAYYEAAKTDGYSDMIELRKAFIRAWESEIEGFTAYLSGNEVKVEDFRIKLNLLDQQLKAMNKVSILNSELELAGEFEAFKKDVDFHFNLTTSIPGKFRELIKSNKKFDDYITPLRAHIGIKDNALKKSYNKLMKREEGDVPCQNLFGFTTKELLDEIPESENECKKFAEDYELSGGGDDSTKIKRTELFITRLEGLNYLGEGGIEVGVLESGYGLKTYVNEMYTYKNKENLYGKSLTNVMKKVSEEDRFLPASINFTTENLSTEIGRVSGLLDQVGKSYSNAGNVDLNKLAKILGAKLFYDESPECGLNATLVPLVAKNICEALRLKCLDTVEGEGFKEFLRKALEENGDISILLEGSGKSSVTMDCLVKKIKAYFSENAGLLTSEVNKDASIGDLARVTNINEKIWLLMPSLSGDANSGHIEEGDMENLGALLNKFATKAQIAGKTSSLVLLISQLVQHTWIIKKAIEYPDPNKILKEVGVIFKAINEDGIFKELGSDNVLRNLLAEITRGVVNSCFRQYGFRLDELDVSAESKSALEILKSENSMRQSFRELAEYKEGKISGELIVGSYIPEAFKDSLNGFQGKINQEILKLAKVLLLEIKKDKSSCKAELEGFIGKAQLAYGLNYSTLFHRLVENYEGGEEGTDHLKGIRLVKLANEKSKILGNENIISFSNKVREKLSDFFNLAPPDENSSVVNNGNFKVKESLVLLKQLEKYSDENEDVKEILSKMEFLRDNKNENIPLILKFANLTQGELSGTYPGVKFDDLKELKGILVSLGVVKPGDYDGIVGKTVSESLKISMEDLVTRANNTGEGEELVLKLKELDSDRKGDLGALENVQAQFGQINSSLDKFLEVGFLKNQNLDEIKSKFISVCSDYITTGQKGYEELLLLEPLDDKSIMEKIGGFKDAFSSLKNNIKKLHKLLINLEENNKKITENLIKLNQNKEEFSDSDYVVDLSILRNLIFSNKSPVFGDVNSGNVQEEFKGLIINHGIRHFLNSKINSGESFVSILKNALSALIDKKISKLLDEVSVDGLSLEEKYLEIFRSLHRDGADLLNDIIIENPDRRIENREGLFEETVSEIDVLFKEKFDEKIKQLEGKKLTTNFEYIKNIEELREKVKLFSITDSDPIRISQDEWDEYSKSPEAKVRLESLKSKYIEDAVAFEQGKVRLREFKESNFEKVYRKCLGTEGEKAEEAFENTFYSKSKQDIYVREKCQLLKDFRDPRIVLNARVRVDPEVNEFREFIKEEYEKYEKAVRLDFKTVAEGKKTAKKKTLESTKKKPAESAEEKPVGFTKSVPVKSKKAGAPGATLKMPKIPVLRNYFESHFQALLDKFENEKGDKFKSRFVNSEWNKDGREETFKREFEKSYLKFIDDKLIDAFNESRERGNSSSLGISSSDTKKYGAEFDKGLGRVNERYMHLSLGKGKESYRTLIAGFEKEKKVVRSKKEMEAFRKKVRRSPSAMLNFLGAIENLIDMDKGSYFGITENALSSLRKELISMGLIKYSDSFPPLRALISILLNELVATDSFLPQFLKDRYGVENGYKKEVELISKVNAFLNKSKKEIGFLVLRKVSTNDRFKNKSGLHGEGLRESKDSLYIRNNETHKKVLERFDNYREKGFSEYGTSGGSSALTNHYLFGSKNNTESILGDGSSIVKLAHDSCRVITPYTLDASGNQKEKGSEETLSFEEENGKFITVISDTRFILDPNVLIENPHLYIPFKRFLPLREEGTGRAVILHMCDGKQKFNLFEPDIINPSGLRAFSLVSQEIKDIAKSASKEYVSSFINYNKSLLSKIPVPSNGTRFSDSSFSFFFTYKNWELLKKHTSKYKVEFLSDKKKEKSFQTVEEENDFLVVEWKKELKSMFGSLGINDGLLSSSLVHQGFFDCLLKVPEMSYSILNETASGSTSSCMEEGQVPVLYFTERETGIEKVVEGILKGTEISQKVLEKLRNKRATSNPLEKTESWDDEDQSLRVTALSDVYDGLSEGNVSLAAKKASKEFSVGFRDRALVYNGDIKAKKTEDLLAFSAGSFLYRDYKDKDSPDTYKVDLKKRIGEQKKLFRETEAFHLHIGAEYQKIEIELSRDISAQQGYAGIYSLQDLINLWSKGQLPNKWPGVDLTSVEARDDLFIKIGRYAVLEHSYQIFKPVLGKIAAMDKKADVLFKEIQGSFGSNVSTDYEDINEKIKVFNEDLSLLSQSIQSRVRTFCESARTMTPEFLAKLCFERFERKVLTASQSKYLQEHVFEALPQKWEERGSFSAEPKADLKGSDKYTKVLNLGTGFGKTTMIKAVADFVIRQFEKVPELNESDSKRLCIVMAPESNQGDLNAQLNQYFSSQYDKIPITLNFSGHAENPQGLDWWKNPENFDEILKELEGARENGKRVPVCISMQDRLYLSYAIKVFGSQGNAKISSYNALKKIELMLREGLGIFDEWDSQVCPFNLDEIKGVEEKMGTFIKGLTTGGSVPNAVDVTVNGLLSDQIKFMTSFRDSINLSATTGTLLGSLVRTGSESIEETYKSIVCDAKTTLARTVDWLVKSDLKTYDKNATYEKRMAEALSHAKVELRENAKSDFIIVDSDDVFEEDFSKNTEGKTRIEIRTETAKRIYDFRLEQVNEVFIEKYNAFLKLKKPSADQLDSKADDFTWSKFKALKGKELEELKKTCANRKEEEMLQEIFVLMKKSQDFKVVCQAPDITGKLVLHMYTSGDKLVPISADDLKHYRNQTQGLNICYYLNKEGEVGVDVPQGWDEDLLSGFGKHSVYTTGLKASGHQTQRMGRARKMDLGQKQVLLLEKDLYLGVELQTDEKKGMKDVLIREMLLKDFSSNSLIYDSLTIKSRVEAELNSLEDQAFKDYGDKESFNEVLKEGYIKYGFNTERDKRSIEDLNWSLEVPAFKESNMQELDPDRVFLDETSPDEREELLKDRLFQKRNTAKKTVQTACNLENERKFKKSAFDIGWTIEDADLNTEKGSIFNELTEVVDVDKILKRDAVNNFHLGLKGDVSDWIDDWISPSFSTRVSSTIGGKKDFYYSPWLLMFKYISRTTAVGGGYPGDKADNSFNNILVKSYWEWRESDATKSASIRKSLMGADYTSFGCEEKHKNMVAFLEGFKKHAIKNIMAKIKGKSKDEVGSFLDQLHKTTMTSLKTGEDSLMDNYKQCLPIRNFRGGSFLDCLWKHGVSLSLTNSSSYGTGAKKKLKLDTHFKTLKGVLEVNEGSVKRRVAERKKLLLIYMANRSKINDDCTTQSKNEVFGGREFLKTVEYYKKYWAQRELVKARESQERESRFAVERVKNTRPGSPQKSTGGSPRLKVIPEGLEETLEEGNNVHLKGITPANRSGTNDGTDNEFSGEEDDSQ
ncbi:hypothetical protein AB751O23_AM_00040 [Chlamydiales bacterium SCGC AB-751-O23]|jgi:hypothetical protein|nr:hypothetical protein AB751O23_AM_00040 [Chlamydiales bacterium SCGC AB-751-O23]